MPERKLVDIDREKAAKIGPAAPIEAVVPSRMGSTFAERAAAAAKAVRAGDDHVVEDKAVKHAASKAPKKKS